MKGCIHRKFKHASVAIIYKTLRSFKIASAFNIKRVKEYYWRNVEDSCYIYLFHNTKYLLFKFGEHLWHLHTTVRTMFTTTLFILALTIKT